MGSVPLGLARFSIVQETTGEALHIAAPRYPSEIGFASMWLAGLMLNVFMSVPDLMRDFQWPMFGKFLTLLVFCLWPASSLSWMFLGKEILRLRDGDLEVSRRLFGCTKKKTYSGREIVHLKPERPARPSNWSMRFLPGIWSTGEGSISFSYGARTQFLAPGLDQTEAQMAIVWLKKQLENRSDDTLGVKHDL